MDTPIPVDLGRIAQDLQIRRVQVESVVQLLDEGNTVPFITRYRKERTGNLNELAIREIQLRVGRQRELAERKETILKAIEAQGKLSDELAAAIRAAENPKRLEDLYLPYKPKKKTKASEARDKGLEPLALRIWNRDETLTDLAAAAQEFLNAEKELDTADKVLEGVGHILAEAVSEMASIREAVRRVVWKTGKILTTKADNLPDDQGQDFRDYFNYSEPVGHIPPHRVLAINRGDKEGPLKVKFDVVRPELERAVLGQLPLEGHPHGEFFGNAAIDALDRLLMPSLEREVRRDLTEMAERHAVEVFARNLRSLLLQPPINRQVVLAVDPGFRTGCKVAVLDPFGNLLDHGVVHPHPPQNRRHEAKQYIKDLVGKHAVGVVAIGNGTACRETEELIAEIIAEGTHFHQNPGQPFPGAPAAAQPATDHAPSEGEGEHGQTEAEHAETHDQAPAEVEHAEAHDQAPTESAPAEAHDQAPAESAPTTETAAPAAEAASTEAAPDAEPAPAEPESNGDNATPPQGQGEGEAPAAEPTVESMPPITGGAPDTEPKSTGDQVRQPRPDEQGTTPSEPDAPPAAGYSEQNIPGTQADRADVLEKPGAGRNPANEDKDKDSSPPPITGGAPDDEHQPPPAEQSADQTPIDTTPPPTPESEGEQPASGADPNVAPAPEATSTGGPDESPTTAEPTPAATPATEEIRPDNVDAGAEAAPVEPAPPVVTAEAPPPVDPAAPAATDALTTPAEAVAGQPATSEAAAEGEGEGEGAAPTAAPTPAADFTRPPKAPPQGARPEKPARPKQEGGQRPPRPKGPPPPPQAHPADAQVAQLAYVIVNEAGASVYSASPVGREEFPEFDATLRGTISIGRRLQDPLAELVKIEPQNIGVGLYQHDVNPKQLKESLETVIESCVNFVGVDLNTASIPLLRHVSGLNALTARRIVERRQQQGPFANREQLQEIEGVGPVTYTQAAGFLKLRDDAHPLDRTWVHPESYEVATRALQSLGFGPEVILDKERLPELHAKMNEADVPTLAKELGVGEPTLHDIFEALARPERDPREDLPKPIFKRGILKLEDLTAGMELKGTVLNVVDFGAFVDIGLKDSGLVHISQLANRYIKSPHDVVSVGDVVTVWVMSVDQDRKRVSLTMVAPGTERPRAERGERGPRRGGEGRGPGGPGGPGGERRGAGGGRGPRREGGPPPQGGEGQPAEAGGGQGGGRVPGPPQRGARVPGPPQRAGGGPGRGPRPGGGGPRREGGPGGGPGGGAGRFERAQAPRQPPRPAKPAPPPPPLSKDALTGNVPLRSFGQLKQLFEARTQDDEPEGQPQDQPQTQAPTPGENPPAQENPPAGE